jgi:ferredoxin-NADP reductase
MIGNQVLVGGVVEVINEDWGRAVAIVAHPDDAVTLRLRLEDSANFLPGQYYNVRRLVPGRTGPIQRIYSVASSPVPATSVIDIGVREVPGDLISPQLVRGLSVGWAL